jgi:hypothetical protein
MPEKVTVQIYVSIVDETGKNMMVTPKDNYKGIDLNEAITFLTEVREQIAEGKKD